MDPPREEAMEAVKVCRQVSIRPVMITGDHKLTAVAVAKEVGIFREGDSVLTGEELAKMDEAALAAVVEKVIGVRARFADGQAQDRARLEGQGPRRGDDGRRRQRRAGAQACRHRRRDGHLRHRRRQGSRRHRAGGRQLRHHRQGDRARPLDLRQHPEVPDLPAAREHHGGRGARRRGDVPRARLPAAAAGGHSLHQPRERRLAGAGAGHRAARQGHHAAAAARSERKRVLVRRAHIHPARGASSNARSSCGCSSTTWATSRSRAPRCS